MSDTSMVFENIDALRELCGRDNLQLRQLAKAAGVLLHQRGNEIAFQGEDLAVQYAKEAILQLYKLCLSGKLLSADDMVRAVALLAKHPESNLKTIFTDTVFVPKVGKAVTPKSLAQKLYVDAVRKNDIVFAMGPAGTGKTYLAMAMAVRALVDKKVKRIVLTRPAVEAGEHLGFLPGTLEEKVDPYLRPLFDAISEMLDFDRTRKLMEQGVIEVAPLAFMRGRTLNDSYVILDEAQNTTREQMKMFLTRLGFGSKAIVTGDGSQSDLPKGGKSGLMDAAEILQDIPGIALCRFSDVDVVRHPLVQRIIRAYERHAEN